MNKQFCKFVSDIEVVLKIWKLINLTLEGKITIFKTLALSKIVYFSLVTEIPTQNY